MIDFITPAYYHWVPYYQHIGFTIFDVAFAHVLYFLFNSKSWVNVGLEFAAFSCETGGATDIKTAWIDTFTLTFDLDYS